MKVKEIINKKLEAKINTDAYVPVTIEYSGYNPSPYDFLFEYRFFNSNDSFIEIRVNNNEKEIKSVTIMSVKNINKELPIDLDNIICIEGTPVIDTSGNDWRELSYCRLLDINNDFKLYYVEQKFITLFDGYSEVCKKIKMPHMQLLVNTNDIIVGFIINEIPDTNLFAQNIFALK